MGGVPEKHALFLSYYFPPYPSVATVRAENYSVALLSHFHHIHCLTHVRHPLELPKITTYTLSKFDIRSIIKRKNLKAQSQSGSKNFLLRLTNSFPFDLILGLGGIIYILHATYRAIMLIKRNPITLIVSTYPPFADHYAAWIIKLFYPSIMWIADMRDLRSDVHKKEVVGLQFQQWIDRKILGRADVVTTVSEGLKNQINMERVEVLYNAIGHSSSRISPKEFLVNKESTFCIAYTGNLYSHWNDLGLLIRIINLLIDNQVLDKDQIKLHYAGKDGKELKALTPVNLDKVVVDHGWISREAVFSLQRNAHVNLLMTYTFGNNSGYLSGKLAEYIDAQTPILALLNGKMDSELEQIISLHNDGVVISNQQLHAEAAAMAFLSRQIDLWRMKKRGYSKSGDSFQWKNQIQKIAKYVS